MFSVAACGYAAGPSARFIPSWSAHAAQRSARQRERGVAFLWQQTSGRASAGARQVTRRRAATSGSCVAQPSNLHQPSLRRISAATLHTGKRAQQGPGAPRAARDAPQVSGLTGGAPGVSSHDARQQATVLPGGCHLGQASPLHRVAASGPQGELGFSWCWCHSEQLLMRSSLASS